MNISNTKVSYRLGMGFGLILALLVTISVISVIRFSSFNDNVKVLAEHKVPNLQMSDAWTIAVLEASRHTRNMLILEDKALIQKEVDAVRDLQRERATYAETLEKNITSEEGKAALQRVMSARAANVEAENAYLKLVEAGDMAAAKIDLLGKLRPAQLVNIDELDHLIDIEKNVVQKASQSAEQDYQFGRNLVLAITVFGIVAGICIAVAITRSLIKQLGAEPSYAAEVASRIAAGDLASNIALQSGDQTSLMRAIKDMRDKLAQIVAEVREGADSIKAASGEIASGNQDLSNRTEQQAAALEETASSMEELTSTVKQNADNATQANRLAVAASNVALRGGEVVDQVVQTMGDINESSRRITDIISVIDGIAFQTNILALNAAVEAARAGEQGRGFAVVAAEVRNLAQRSAAAAKEIKSLIEDSTEKVGAGTRLVGEAGSTTREVLDNVKQLGDLVAEISAASREQATGIEQVNQSVTHMDETTQQNASLVEQAAAASEAMRDQASHLADIVKVFQLDATRQKAAVHGSTVIPLKRPAAKIGASAKQALPVARKRLLSVASGAPAGGDWEQF